MVTIAFAFIVQHGTIEWRDLTGGQNGLMGLAQPRSARCFAASARWRCSPSLLAGVSLYLFHRLARSGWGKAMVAVRDSETAARSIGLNPVIDQDRGLRAVRGVRRSRRRYLRAADDVRCAGLVPILAVDPVPVRGDRGRRRLGVRAGGRRGGHRGAAGAPLRSRRVSPAVLRRAAAGGAVGGAGRRRSARWPASARREPQPAAGADFDLAAFLQPPGPARRSTSAASASRSAASRPPPT